MSVSERVDAPNPLEEGLRRRRAPEPCALTIFGASGDLTQRKLFPALYQLARAGHLPAFCRRSSASSESRAPR